MSTAFNNNVNELMHLLIHFFRKINGFYKPCSRFKVQGSLLFVTYTIIQGIISSEMLVRTGPLNGKCKKIKNNNKIKIT